MEKRSQRVSLLISSAIVLLFVAVVLAAFFGRPFLYLVYEHKCGEDTNSANSLSLSDIDFGERQLIAMLADRPRMKPYVSRADPVWTWTSHQFAGEGTGVRIRWCAKCPSGGEENDAFSSNCGLAEGAYIYVPDYQIEQDHIGELQWNDAVFELYNCRVGKEYVELCRKAATAELQETDFVRAVVELESLAVKSSQRFYDEKWHLQSCTNLHGSHEWIWKNSGDATSRKRYLQFYHSQFKMIRAQGPAFWRCAKTPKLR